MREASRSESVVLCNFGGAGLLKEAPYLRSVVVVVLRTVLTARHRGVPGGSLPLLAVVLVMVGVLRPLAPTQRAGDAAEPAGAGSASEL